MTANVTFGKSFSGLESYLSNKIEQGINKSELIYFENVAPEVNLKLIDGKHVYEVMPNAISKEMKHHVKSQNTKVQKPVMHTSFNFPKNEILSNSQMIDASLSALKEVGITPDNHQITMYRHQDKAHHHVHCIINRVGLNGKVHNNSFIANRLMVACDKVEKEQNLQPTKGRIFVFDEKAKNGYRMQSNAERLNTSKPKLTKKQRIQAVHDKVKAEFNRELKTANSLDEIKANLSNKGIETNISRNKNGVYGLSFRADDIAVKASKLGIKAKQVEPTISERIEKEKQNQIKELFEYNINYNIKEWKSLRQIHADRKANFTAMIKDYSKNPKQNTDNLHQKYGFYSGKFDYYLNRFHSSITQERTKISNEFNALQTRLKELQAKPIEKANFWQSRAVKEQIKFNNSYRERDIKEVKSKLADYKENAKSIYLNRIKDVYDNTISSGHASLEKDFNLEKQGIKAEILNYGVTDIEKEILKRENPNAFAIQEQRAKALEREKAKEKEERQDQPQRRGGYGR